MPLVFALTGGNAEALYRCSQDQIARPTCCCAADASPVRPTVSAASCCTIEISKVAPAEPRAQAAPVASVKASAAPVVVLAQAPDVGTWRQVKRGAARAPRPPNPSSLLALKTSFLR